MAGDRLRYIEAYPSDSKKTIGMLLEDVHFVIYGGGRRSEGQLPVTTGADDGCRRWQRCGLHGLGPGRRDDRNRLRPDQRHGRRLGEQTRPTIAQRMASAGPRRTNFITKYSVYSWR